MNPLAKAKQQIFVIVFIGSCIVIGLSVASALIAYNYFAMELIETLMVAAITGLLTALAISEWASDIAIEPIKILDKATAVLARNNHEALPNPENLTFAKESTSQILKDIYDITTKDNKEHSSEQIKINSAINNIDTPILSLDRNLQIKFHNLAAEKLANKTIDKLTGSEFKKAFELKFDDGVSFSDWVSTTQQNKIHDCSTWRRVKMHINEEVKYLDMHACFNKGDSQGNEYSIVLFDQTDKYSANEREISFVSLAVHELRSPLTVLRGYIEVFQDEVGPTLTEEYQRFMNKMSVSAGQLSTFVNNILNVSRIENEQMSINPVELKWSEYIDEYSADLKIRCEVRGRNINISIPEDLPTVAADPVSIFEVLSNMVDNAIKYTGKNGEINISAQLIDGGMIETSVQDNGIGIPTSVMDHLFDKYYRSHRSRENIGGTGLGLFLSKKIVESHGGEIWVKSKEGEGSTFGFNLPTFESVQHKLDNPDNIGLQRSTSGWIKNHGKVRR